MEFTIITMRDNIRKAIELAKCERFDHSMTECAMNMRARRNLDPETSTAEEAGIGNYCSHCHECGNDEVVHGDNCGDEFTICKSCTTELLKMFKEDKE
jgi:hypothetical protein